MKKMIFVFLISILLGGLISACGSSEPTEAEVQQQINEETTEMLQTVNGCLRAEFNEYEGGWSEESLQFCQDILLAGNFHPPVGTVCEGVWNKFAYECDQNWDSRSNLYTNILHAYGYNLPNEYQFTLTNVPLTNGSTVLYMSVQMVTYVEENTTYYLDRQGIAEACTSGIGCIERGNPQLSVMLNYYKHQVPLFHEIAPTGWVHLLAFRLNNHCDNFSQSGLRFQRYEHENCYFSDN